MFLTHFCKRIYCSGSKPGAASLKHISRSISTTGNPVMQALKQRVSESPEDAFYVVDVDEVRRKNVEWKTLLPRVHPFYAIKCNPDQQILNALAEEGAGFDCASAAEIDAALAAGVAPENIIYANPCKQASHLQHAANKGVGMTTFDNADELMKIAALHPGATAVLRIATDDRDARVRLSQKFGASLDQVPELLRLAAELGVKVDGVSYHVGSGATSVEAFVEGVTGARAAFDMAASVGARMSMVDIGGGFPGHASATLKDVWSASSDAVPTLPPTPDLFQLHVDDAELDPYGVGMSAADLEAGDTELTLTFDKIAGALRPALDAAFPAGDGCPQLIAEPGRYMVNSSHTLAVRVIARRTVQPEASSLPTGAAAAPAFMYYVNDGVYGSFNCLLYDHAKVTPLALADAVAQQEPCTQKQQQLVAAAAAAGGGASVETTAGNSAEITMLQQQLVAQQRAVWKDTASSPYTATATATTGSGSDNSGEADVTPRQQFPSSIWGPTCDGLDCVVSRTALPRLGVGDWLYFKDMGAYTCAASSSFNGFTPPQKMYIDSRPSAQQQQ